jgi:hypothetical protein
MSNALASFVNYSRRLEASAAQLAEALRAVQVRHPCNCKDGYDRHTASMALMEYAELLEEINTNKKD